ncbi:MAG TPA: hypothetical protein VM529_11020 [Gemmata sp.]|nr:hypothetical protein [Gemmata sp.]
MAKLTPEIDLELEVMGNVIQQLLRLPSPRGRGRILVFCSDMVSQQDADDFEREMAAGETLKEWDLDDVVVPKTPLITEVHSTP